MGRSKKAKSGKSKAGLNASAVPSTATRKSKRKKRHESKRALRIRNKAAGDGASEVEEQEEQEEQEEEQEEEEDEEEDEEEMSDDVSSLPKVDEATIELWKSVYELEKNRFSFFDQLFASGFVVDSLEVMSQGPNEPEDHFVEAEEEDFIQKTDYGRVVMKTKHVYTGNFDDWYFTGPGRYVWIDGTIYQGDFKNGVMHGKGAIHWPDGSVYEGEFVNGDRSPGWNVYSTTDGFTYAGDWQSGLPHGKGKIWYDPTLDDTDYYEGAWENGLQHGFGTRQYPNGDRYIGNWEGGERSGQGTMIWLDERQVYKGQWQNGIPNGKGKHIWYLERTNGHIFPSRHVYFGDWQDGKRHGIGKMIYPCGSTYEGRWKDGQREGKGVFLNPAGALITGLFKSGDLIGGTGVPLHSPTYDCDFSGLVEYLTSKFHLKLENEEEEERKLKETVSRFLEPLRTLYQRAGELAHNWGNNGLYPHWLKSSSGSDHRIINHHETGIPQHMEGKSVNPPSPDGIYPVTRMGLWLLLKDCPKLTKDVTIAYFDKHFGDTPSVSFQTRHNPFEPVLLWQFLQCLVITAVSIYLEIPNHKRRLRYPKTAPRPRVKKEKKSLVAEVPEASPHPENEGKDSPSAQRNSTSKKNGVKRNKRQKGSNSKKSDKDNVTTISTEDEEEGSHAEDDQVNEGDQNVPSTVAPDDEGEHLAEGNGIEKQERIRGKMSKREAEWESEDPSDSGDDTLGLFSPETQAKNASYNLSISEAFDTFLIEKLFPCLEILPGQNLPMVPNPLPSFKDMFEVFQKINGGNEHISASEFMRSLLSHRIQPSMDEVLFWHRCPEVLSAKVNLEEMFEAQKRKQSFYQQDAADINNEAGSGGMIPREVLDALVGVDEDADEDDDFLGGRPHNVSLSEKFPVVGDDDGDNNRASAGVMEFMSDPLPFADEDLPKEPFLWDEEQKCDPLLLEKFNTMNTDADLTTDDVINILRTLYPKLVGKPGETNIHFDMVFCDWLWGISLVAKLSTDREMKIKPGTRPSHSGLVNDVIN